MEKARVILISHLGRPKGTFVPGEQPDLRYSLAPVAKTLGTLLAQPVAFAPDCVGPAAQSAVQNLKEGTVLLLENLRFHPEEEKNDPAFAKALASLADLFVQDAFGAVHRAHASTDTLAQQLPHAAGFLLLKELQFLTQIRDNPARPFMALVGGAKVSDKIEVLEKLLGKVDTLAIGGAMAYTFLTALGIPVGQSRVEKDKIDMAKSLLEKAKKQGVEIILPLDHRIVKAVEKPETLCITGGPSIPSDSLGVDIGPKTLEAISIPLKKAKTIFWNGPMGIFEIDAYAQGTNGVAHLAAQAAEGDNVPGDNVPGATVIIGGGDSVAAIQKTGLADKITHISTGGGASLEFLEGKELPGISILKQEGNIRSRGTMSRGIPCTL
jgi:3-phosphoglycerate kinase